MENPIEKFGKEIVAAAANEFRKTLAEAGNAALDGALAQAPILDALVNGREVELVCKFQMRVKE